MFSLSESPLEQLNLKSRLKNPRAGGFVCFEGWVRNFNEGKEVVLLEYESYASMAAKEFAKIVAEAQEQFTILDLYCAHRVGQLQIGEMAVWIGVIAVHREAAFSACQYLIDQLKVRVPIWKKEHYIDGNSGWIGCHECSKRAHIHS